MAQAEFRAEVKDWPVERIEAYIAGHYPAYWLKVDLAHKISNAHFLKSAQAAGKGVANVIRVALEEMMAWTARMGVVVKELEMLTILEGGIGKGIGPLSVIGPGGFQKTIGVPCSPFRTRPPIFLAWLKVSQSGSG